MRSISWSCSCSARACGVEGRTTSIVSVSAAGYGGGRVAGSGAGAGVVVGSIDWLAYGWAGSGRVGVSVGWSVTDTLVLLVSIGADLTTCLFFDGMLGDRRCAGGVGIISSTVGPADSGILQASNPKMMRCEQCGSLKS